MGGRRGPAPDLWAHFEPGVQPPSQPQPGRPPGAGRGGVRRPVKEAAARMRRAEFKNEGNTIREDFYLRQRAACWRIMDLTFKASWDWECRRPSSRLRGEGDVFFFCLPTKELLTFLFLCPRRMKRILVPALPRPRILPVRMYSAETVQAHSCLRNPAARTRDARRVSGPPRPAAPNLLQPERRSFPPRTRAFVQILPPSLLHSVPDYWNGLMYLL